MTDQPNTPLDDPQMNTQSEQPFTEPYTESTTASTPEPGTQTQSRPTPLAAFLEHQSNAAQETIQALQALVPPDFRLHSAAARHELMLSFKVLVDGATEAIETELNRARDAAAKAANNSKPNVDSNDAGATGSDRPSTTGKSKVKVEVL